MSLGKKEVIIVNIVSDVLSVCVSGYGTVTVWGSCVVYVSSVTVVCQIRPGRI